MEQHSRDAAHPSNPDHPHLQQIFTTLVSWDQIERFLLPKIAEYDARFPPSAPTTDDPANPNNVFVHYNRSATLSTPAAAEEPTPARDPCTVCPASAIAGMRAGLTQRLNLPFHQHMNRESTRNTLRYLFFHMRCGVYVMIRHGKVRMFVPFVNAEYKNTWAEHLYWEPGHKDLREYYQEKQNFYREENVIDDVSSWWANGNIICNEHCRKGQTQSQFWGDQFLSPWRDLLHHLCDKRQVADCELFLNKRDYPHLKVNVERGLAVEPYGFVYDRDDRDPSQDVPLSRECHATYAPIASFYCGHADRFADLPIPSSEDWESATGLIYPPSFITEEQKGKTVLKNPRDLFTDENFRKFERPWESKKPTALFRGTATGGGTTEQTNQRVRAAALSHRWKSDNRFNGESTGGHPFLDAAITGWNLRDKKICGQPMGFVKTASFPFRGGRENFIPIYEQSAYKYLLYIDGHCAACRYAFMMRLGGVILKVESAQVADQMWYFPLLRPWVDHVPVAPDLSDLADKIQWCRDHDEECRAIAEKAKVIYDTFIGERGVLDYMELLTHEVGKRWRYPPAWWSEPPPARPAPSIPSAAPPNPADHTCYTDDQQRDVQCVRCQREVARLQAAAAEAAESSKRRRTEGGGQPDGASGGGPVRPKISLRDRMRHKAKR